MKVSSLKPFDDGKYLSEEESLKLLESIPIPKDDFGSVSPAEEKSQTPLTENFDLENRIIDLNQVDDSTLRKQDEWIDYFNARNVIMVSTPDLYLAGRTNNQGLLNSLRKDFNASWFVTSTRIMYGSNQKARIIHYYGSQLVRPVEHQVVIPEYRQKLLADVLETKEGLTYLQALLGTNHNAQQIKDTLENLSGFSPNQTEVWSDPLSSRPTEKISCFAYGAVVFKVTVSGSRDLFGYSHAICTNTTPKSGGSP